MLLTFIWCDRQEPSHPPSWLKRFVTFLIFSKKVWIISRLNHNHFRPVLLSSSVTSHAFWKAVQCEIPTALSNELHTNPHLHNQCFYYKLTIMKSDFVCLLNWLQVRIRQELVCQKFPARIFHTLYIGMFPQYPPFTPRLSTRSVLFSLSSKFWAHFSSLICAAWPSPFSSSL